MWNFKNSWLFLAIVLVSVSVASCRSRGKNSNPQSANNPQLVVQLGHSGGISSAAFSPDGRFTVSGGADMLGLGGADKVAVLWETATGREVRRFTGHSYSINSVTFSPDSRFVLTGSGGIGDSNEGGEENDFTARLWDIATGKEIRRFIGHTDAVSSVAFSPDGHFALTGSHDKTVRLWNVEDGREVYQFVGHESPINSVAFSPDGRLILSDDDGSSSDSTAHSLDVAPQMGGSWQRFFPSSGSTRLWDLATKQEIRRFAGHENECINGSSVAFSPDSRFGITGCRNPYPFGSDSTVYLWDIATGRRIRQFEGYGPATFSPDGLQILTAEGNGLNLWETDTGKRTKFLSWPIQDSEAWIVESASFSPNGKSVLVVIGERESGGNMGYVEGKVALFLYDLAAEEMRHFEGGTSSLADDLAFSSDGNFLLSANGLWDTRAGNEIRFKGYTFDEAGFRKSGNEVVARRAISRDGQFALTLKISYDLGLQVENGSTVQLWGIATGEKLAEVTKLDHVTGVWFSPDSRFFFIFSSWMDTETWMVECRERTTIRVIWQYKFKRDLWHHTIYRQRSRANTDCALSPDGHLFAVRELGGTSEDTGRITLLNAETGHLINRLKIPSGYRFVDMLAFSPDSRLLLTGEDSGDLGYGDVENLYLYDVTTGRLEKAFQVSSNPESAVAFSPDGHFLLTGSYNIIDGDSPRIGDEEIVQLWEVTTKKEAHRFRNQSSRYVVFSPDSRFLLTTGYIDDRTVYLWELATGKEVRRFEGHADKVTSIAVSPNGRFVLTGSADHTERLWDISTGQELCRLVSSRNGDWIVTTPDGRFDSNNLENIKGLHWIIPNDPLKPLPLEIFMRQYYEPRLLARVLAGEKFKTLPKISELNRTQPGVNIIGIQPDSAETVQVNVEVANIESTVQKNSQGASLKSGAYDLRLFRNGQLVGYAPENDGEVKLNVDGKTTLKFSNIKLPRTGVEQVEFSAYAFNADRVKSVTDRKTYQLTPKPAPVKGRAYLIRLGVNAAEREGLHLRYAANDARQANELATRLVARGEYQEVVSLPLISDYTVALADGRTLAAHDATIEEVRAGRKRVTENTATKAHLRAVLDVLAGRQADAPLLKQIPNADKLHAARPEDLVLISASSHGYTDNNGIFYLVPSDSGTAPPASPEFRSRCISSDELSRWLRDVDAGELVLIVDACHSAAAIEGTDFKPGPMGSRGLGQLSYDKGMRILTATQADNVALEANQVRQGLLIYALLVDGLTGWQADYKPRDKAILLTEWLGYGVERVPQLYEEVKGGRIRGTFDPRELEDSKRQQPALFDFARRRREVVLARQP